MKLTDFDYRLPDELVAQEPLAERSASRMLVVDRATGTLEDSVFVKLPDYLKPGDCLVLNDSRVFPARLFGKCDQYHREVEVFLVQPASHDRRLWNALVRPGRKLPVGAEVWFSPTLSCDILDVGRGGERVVHFRTHNDIDAEIAAIGHVPLPPYIHRKDEPRDRERYQTVYAGKPGSSAAPTAGLHFTPEVLEACQRAGAALAKVTLHVGLGTFQPLQNDEVAKNQLHSESFQVEQWAAESIRQAARVVAAGTTAVRTLETVARRNGGFDACSGETNIFIYPGQEFSAVGAMLTNFHLPKSSLLLLVCAFGGVELMLNAYRHAVEQRYRFFSYGDCMLIL
ncbi:MAG TPA: tRNA preQ1(34) S-adenosylmethionine ribosyltransferase-isomerase QueA [Bryobacteraceae bacterium]|nr:tRNA preQ1(34) S-adenosylmethionine ribosyltransferase-isomerase QueA [Bryobacteraceae bacterium]HPT27910.1 tRNA preQ1(34) S-adenosylmethionine ribosyltransferase-isomerase QueA [Bryobacteraceae bacterium]